MQIRAPDANKVRNANRRCVTANKIGKSASKSAQAANKVRSANKNKETAIKIGKRTIKN